MTWNNVFCNTFEALSEELGLPPAGKSLVELCRAIDLSVVSVLEEHASEEQKERCIDILDFITESSP